MARRAWHHREEPPVEDDSTHVRLLLENLTTGERYTKVVPKTGYKTAPQGSKILGVIGKMNLKGMTKNAGHPINCDCEKCR